MQDGGRVSGNDRVRRDIPRHYTSGADQRVFPDSNTTKEGSTGANRGPSFDERILAGPVRIALQGATAGCGSGVSVVDEDYAVAYKNLIFNRDSFTYERVARYLASLADRCALLYFDKRSNPGFVSNHAAIEIDKCLDPHITAERYVRSDQLMHRGRIAHAEIARFCVTAESGVGGLATASSGACKKGTGEPCALSEAEAASRIRTSSNPSRPPVIG